eukprot:TRINITY_DN76836_c0_g1_i1.p1 TRINITY_DN76836_c0_g1~~TRINITY_DN76836_c0_g1_i1.p1  ORF type:complete len:897 (-),score=265.29 TRINITY_DN76836_c0_g1_i1:50-2740(-)
MEAAVCSTEGDETFGGSSSSTCGAARHSSWRRRAAGCVSPLVLWRLAAAGFAGTLSAVLVQRCHDLAFAYSGKIAQALVSRSSRTASRGRKTTVQQKREMSRWQRQEKRKREGRGSDVSREPKAAWSGAKAARQQFLLSRVNDKYIRQSELKEVVQELRERRLLERPQEFSILVSALAKRGLQSLLFEILDEMDSLFDKPNMITYSTAISSNTAAGGDWALGLFLFRRLQGRVGDDAAKSAEPNVITYNAVITAMEKSKRWELALEVLEELLTSEVDPTEASYSAAITACRHSQQWEMALHYHEDMLRRGLRGNLLTWTSLILALEKSFQPALAVQAFGQMKREGFQPDESVYDSVLRACAKGGLWKRAIFLINKMIEAGMQPSAAAYSNAIAACGAKESRRSILLFEEMRSKELRPSPSAYSAVMAAYASEGRHDVVLRLFEEMKAFWRPNYAAYAEAMRAIDQHERSSDESPLQKRGFARKQLKLFKEMRSFNVTPPDAACFNVAARAHVACEEGEEATAIIEEALSIGLKPSGGACEAVVAALSSADDEVSEERHKNLFAAGVQGYLGACNARKALRLFQQMKHSGFSPDKELYDKIILGCEAEASMASLPTQLFEEMQTLGMQPAAETSIALIRSKAKEACWSEALQLFAELRSSGVLLPKGKDLSLLESAGLAAIQACQAGAGWQQALNILDDVRSKGLTLGSELYEAAIASCAEDEWRPASALVAKMRSVGLKPSEAAQRAATPVLESSLDSVQEMERQEIPLSQELLRSAIAEAKVAGDRDLARELTLKLRNLVTGVEQVRETGKKRSGRKKRKKARGVQQQPSGPRREHAEGASRTAALPASRQAKGGSWSVEGRASADLDDEEEDDDGDGWHGDNSDKDWAPRISYF